MCRLRRVVVEIYVVVVYCSAKEDGADVTDVSVREFETWIDVSIPRVQWNVSPVPISGIFVSETYESLRNMLSVPGRRGYSLVFLTEH